VAPANFSHRHLMRRNPKYPIPEFVAPYMDQARYQRWLGRKADSHKVRDRARGNQDASRESYMVAIHAAIVRSGGVDEYTGLPLRWDLIGTYDNQLSGSQRRVYKKAHADLPTVDHVSDGNGPPDFAICSWRVNDAKHDLSIEEFLVVCRQVLDHRRGRTSL
jgi:hypothetical protein